MWRGWVLAAMLGAAAWGQQAPFRFASTTRLVLVNLSVHDGSGGFVRDLTPTDVHVDEDGQPQAITSMELEDLDRDPEADTAAMVPEQTHGRRLIVLLFDWTTLPWSGGANPGEAAVEWTLDYVKAQMAPADTVEIVSLGKSLELTQPFTSDPARLIAALSPLREQAMAMAPPPAPAAGRAEPSAGGSGRGGRGSRAGAANPPASDPEVPPELADRSLMAIREVCNSLAPLAGRKSLVIFSAGMAGSEYRLREAERAAQAANVALYPWDARGLVAEAPAAGPEALPASLQFLSALALDTGGAPLFGVNDPGPLFAKIHQDASSYYLVGYYSTNPAQDGGLRKIKVTVARPGVTLAYRDRYFAPLEFSRLSAAERKEQLRDEALADEPEMALSVAVKAGFARDGGRYHLAVRAPVSPAEWPPQAAAEVLVLVEDIAGHEVAETSGLLRPGAAPEFDANFELAAGAYRVLAAVRENASGKMGAAAETIDIH